MTNPGDRLVAQLEEVMALDAHGFWLTGWVHTAQPQEVRLTAVSPEGARRTPVPGAVTFHPRPDLAERLKDDDTISTLGFHAFVELEQPSRDPTGWGLELRTASGHAIQETAADPVQFDGAKVSDLVLEQIRGTSPDESVFSHLVLPALARLRGGSHEAQIERTFEFGPVPASPETSLVIAVRRVDRIEHQLAQFVRAPEIFATEIIFVVARGGGSDELAAVAEELQLLYGLPFRVMELSRPARPARGLNLGASVARGACLVLMSGDVLPRTTGWVQALRSQYESSPTIGAVGPKLLHEDDSIAHAGATYVRRGVPARWRRTLEFAGLARTLRAASFARPVEAVSDSCMMVAAERFDACGGFSELYLGPGDEAGDLCMRLAEDGGEIWYCADAELYNLDRPEVPSGQSPAAARFNDWLFTERWAVRLAWTIADAAAVN